MKRLLFISLLCVTANGPALAGEPGRPDVRDVRSTNFLLHTDLEEDEARKLLDRLETMLSIISRYWGASNRKTIECFVVEDVNNWPPGTLHPQARDIVSNRGVTVAQGVRRGRQLNMTAVVYAANRFGTPLHEAVHAFCYQTFGDTGPTWYAEGMAEMGNYWKKGDSTVTAPAYVIQYLKQSERKRVSEITESGQKTGDGWQNYAWRWALCHFMVNNRNYRDRFRILGAGMLQKRSAGFSRTFRTKMPELEFEFEQFVTHLQQGYDVDRCTWDWSVRPRDLAPGKTVTKKLRADRGWQPLALSVNSDRKYIVSTTGSWRVAPETEVTPDATVSVDAGGIEGAIFDDHKLSKPFRVTPGNPFDVPHAGQLVLRCSGQWNSVADNSGSIAITVQQVD